MQKKDISALTEPNAQRDLSALIEAPLPLFLCMRAIRNGAFVP
jgi:hypothetical protein